MSELDNVQVGKKLETAAGEALGFLIKAFRGGVDLGDESQRRLLAAASSTTSAWSKFQQTQSAREATRFTMAAMLARDEGRLADYMRLTMPAHSVTRQLPSGTGPDEASQSEASHGGARLGTAEQGDDTTTNGSQRGQARSGEARLGRAMHSPAGQG